MNTEVIKKDKWKIEKIEQMTKITDNEITINNTSTEKKEIKYYKQICIQDPNIKQIKVNFYGKFKNAGGYLILNNGLNIPFNSCSLLDVRPPVYLDVRLVVSAESSLSFGDIELQPVYENENLIDKVSTEPDVLIITPSYPSLENLYYCAFAHSRVKEYLNSGLKVQVASISSANWFQTIYDHEGIPVIKGNYADLKSLLIRHQYKVIITHFADENVYPIFDGYISNEKLIFICHGPETVFRYLVNVTRPYFTKELPYPNQNLTMDIKEKWVKKFSQRDNAEWIFVSDWLKEFSEEELGIKFKNVRVINNIMNEDLFPYKEKKEEDRCKILVIRKFDNIIQHSIDQVVLTILELSRRPFFDKLDFEIYGDGNFYDELIEPIRNFNNVHLHRTFIPNNQISKIHEKAGILLIPSRHDAHAVAMGEGASSGLVVVGSNVTSNPFFMNDKENHTLADPEDYVGLANIIERLYNNPKEFLEISKRLSKETRENYCKKNTVQKEIELIKDKLKSYTAKKEKMNVKPVNKPILTIAIPAYNVEQYIEKCLNSILRAPNIEEIEVLVVNDGSKDKTAEIVEEYEKNTNGIVRLINKENGGHGSTINVSITEAKGKYYRLVDGDDWVDSENLAKLVDILKETDADVVLTKGSYEYTNTSQLVDIIKYDNLVEGQRYRFDDLTYKGYGFSTYGPLLTTGNYRLDVLKKANFKISEKRPYVDMEFNSFSLKYVDTLEYYNLDIYRYLIGREGQTISREAWKKKYKDHLYVIYNILENVYNSEEFSECKKKYILNNIIAQMVDSQIFMLDCICKWNEIDEFLEKLKQYPEAYKVSMDLINNRDGNCKLILSEYKNVMAMKAYNEPIIIAGVRERIGDLDIHPIKKSMFNILSKRNVKRVIKCIMPYGLLKLYRKKHRIYIISDKEINMKFFDRLKTFIRKIFVDYKVINKMIEEQSRIASEETVKRMIEECRQSRIESEKTLSRIIEECKQAKILSEENIRNVIKDNSNNMQRICNEFDKIVSMNSKSLEDLSNKIEQLNNPICEANLILEKIKYNNSELQNIMIDKNNLNILLVGFYGAPNLGDELMLETVLDYLENIPNKKVTILLADNPKYNIDKYGDVRFLHYPKNLCDFNVLAEQYDYIIFGGGAIIDDKKYKENNSYQYDLGTILVKLALRAIAFNKKVVCLALSASSEIRDREYLEKLKYIIQNATYFSVRDIYTKKYLQEQFGKEIEEKIINVHDIVFSNRNIFPNIRKDNYIDRTLNIGLVGISNDNNLEKIEMIINGVSKLEGQVNINLIPFYEYNFMDTLFYKKVLEKSNKNINIKIEKYSENMEKTIELYKKNDIIIGIRYHSILLANILNIPCLSICYDINEHYPYKIRYLNELFSQEYAISYKSFQEEDILNRLKNIIQNLKKNNIYGLCQKIAIEAKNEMIETIETIFNKN